MQADAQSLAPTATRLSTLNHLIISTRPWEWLKNAFVLAALFFSKKLLNTDDLMNALLAFGLYNLASGGVYLLNDICDREEDRRHPQKRNRPIACGALPVSTATIGAAFLLAIAIAGAFFLKPLFGLVLAGYLLLNVAYSLWLKQKVILDVFAVAIGFVMRVFAGGVVIEVMVSHWLLICTLLLSLFLGFSKRRHELITLANEAALHRRVLEEYNPLFLDMMISIVTSATVVTYTLYTVSDETVHRFHTNGLLLTVPFVLYGIFRYLYLVYKKNQGGNPSHSLLVDGPLLINTILWIIASGLIIYAAAL